MTHNRLVAGPNPARPTKTLNPREGILFFNFLSGKLFYCQKSTRGFYQVYINAIIVIWLRNNQILISSMPSLKPRLRLYFFSAGSFQ